MGMTGFVTLNLIQGLKIVDRVRNDRVELKNCIQN
jgi:hypothetical protein